MLKQSSNLLKSTRIIANYLCNPHRCSTTDKPRKIKQEFRRPDGNPDLTSPTLGSGRRGPTLEEVKEYLRTEDKILQKMVANFWEECKQLKEEWTTEEPVEPPHGTIDMVYTFENEEKLNNFVVTADTDHDIGHSTASLSSTSRETAIFSGFLSNKLKPDGITKYAGYVNFNSKRPRKSFDRAGYHDFTNYTHLVFKVRGDGRTYNLIVACPEWTEQSSTVQYTYPFYTRGGPYWQISKIPFSKLILGSAGYIQQMRQGMPRNLIARIGLTLGDGIEGPFSLEIDYIGVERNIYHTEENAYETYQIDAPVVN